MRDADTSSYTDTNRNGYSYSYCDCNCHGYTYSYCDVYTQTNADCETTSHTAAAALREP